MRYKPTIADTERALTQYYSDSDGHVSAMTRALKDFCDRIPEPAATSPPVRTMIRVQSTVLAIEDIRSWHRNSKGELVVIHHPNGASEKYAVSTPEYTEDLEAYLRTYYPIAREFSKKGDA